jgi:hypothetical protein
VIAKGESEQKKTDRVMHLVTDGEGKVPIKRLTRKWLAKKKF